MQPTLKMTVVDARPGRRAGPEAYVCVTVYDGERGECAVVVPAKELRGRIDGMLTDPGGCGLVMEGRRVGQVMPVLPKPPPFPLHDTSREDRVMGCWGAFLIVLAIITGLFLVALLIFGG